MKPEHQLQNFLSEQISLYPHMGLSVKEVGNRIVLLAELAKNLNDKGTAFGGSLSVATTLSAWSWLHCHLSLSDDSEQFDIMIQKSELKYLLPVQTDFTCVCESPEDKQVDVFKKTLFAKGRAKLALKTQVYNEYEELCCEFFGTFVAIVKK